MWQVGPGVSAEGSAVFAQDPGVVSSTVEDKDVVGNRVTFRATK